VSEELKKGALLAKYKMLKIYLASLEPVVKMQIIIGKAGKYYPSPIPNEFLRDVILS